MTLDEISVKHKTDKGSLHHCYLALYDLIFQEIVKRSEQRILEIGIQFGNSLKTWKEYFPNPKITGIDVFDNGFRLEGAEIIIVDAYKSEALDKLQGKRFDIIIDDGSHKDTDQAFVVKKYFQFLANDGLLIIEDVLKKETIQLLKSNLPPGFQYTAVRMTEGNGGVDSRLFICWRK